MAEKFVLVEYISNLNYIINQPLQLTQRIKFTSFDVSSHFIVFGATSGGLYIFSRHPCKFIKLLPSKEGSILQLCISQDEETIALSTSKGLIIIFQKFFLDLNVQYQVYSEHMGNNVTFLKWHLASLYCGDNTGKISVILLSNKLSKVFQTPCLSLMQLDSSIVQLDCCSKFLLVSTHTRTYLCDTGKQHYKQIGKKLRDGDFGACFYSKTGICEAAQANEAELSPQTDSDRVIHENFLKIYCARPGCRLWEVDTDASVVQTHQFKDSLKQPLSNIIHLHENANAHLSMRQFPNTIHAIPDSFNLGKIFTFAVKFIFSFVSDRFYILDPENMSLMFWSNYFGSIRDAKVIKSCVYIWSENGQITVLSLLSLERLILKTLFRKQYIICSELCISFKDDILNLVKLSNKIHLISVLKEKLLELHAEEILIELLPLLNDLQEYTDQKLSAQKLKNGIFVIDNAHSFENDRLLENDPNSDTLQALKEISSTVSDKLTERTKNIKEKLQILESTVKNLTMDSAECRNNIKSDNSETNNFIEMESCDTKDTFVHDKVSMKEEPSLDINYNFNILYRQYQLNKINKNMEMPELYDILDLKDQESIVDLFTNFVRYMVELGEEKLDEVEMWCYRQHIKHFIKKGVLFKSENVEIKYLVKSFKAINYTNENSCPCFFPLPKANSKYPEFYEFGCSVLKCMWPELELSTDLCKDVPYLWKYVITHLRNEEDLNTSLPLIIQYSDDSLLSLFLNKFTYDTWDNSVRLLIKVKNGKCLNCDRNLVDQSSYTMSWTSFGTYMVQSIGGASTIKLLMRYAKYIPSAELNNDFYQSCIFATTIDNSLGGFRENAVLFSRRCFTNPTTEYQLDNMLSKYLQRRYTGTLNFNISNNDPKNVGTNCCMCNLPLGAPLFENTLKLDCLHAYHEICLKYNKNNCIKCKKDI